MFILNFIRGFFMALADSVPGVSGGSIAFILGFYDQFILSLNHLVYGKKNEKKKAIVFLLKLAIGWLFGFILSVWFVTAAFERNIYKINSLFIGFILMSIPLIIKEEKDIFSKNYNYLAFTLIGLISVIALTAFNPMTTTDFSADTLYTLHIMTYIFIAGVIAISAMVLPGISGSTLLLILGLYEPILLAIKNVLKFNFESLPVVLIFGFGVITGIALTIKSVSYIFSRYRAATLYTIIGLMIGSIYAIIMGPTSMKIPAPAMNLNSFCIYFFSFGAAIIILLEKSKIFIEKKTL